MRVTIIHKEHCPLCELAIREFTDAGHEVELYGSLQDISDPNRRSDMLASLVTGGGDLDKLPIVFMDDEYTDWSPT